VGQTGALLAAPVLRNSLPTAFNLQNSLGERWGHRLELPTTPAFEEDYRSKRTAPRRKRRACGRSCQTLAPAEPCWLPASGNRGVCMKQDQPQRLQKLDPNTEGVGAGSCSHRVTTSRRSPAGATGVPVASPERLPLHNLLTLLQESRTTPRNSHC